MANPQRIPVSVLTGFLGSGKTTLLAKALRHPAFARTAVIINEMGEIGLDHELIARSSENLIELETGCLCCATRGDLAETLDDLLRRRDQGSIRPFERVVIETSGIADPVPILQLLMTDAGLAGRFILAGVVTTVDAVNGSATLEREPQAPRQVAVADRLIVTKSELTGGLPTGLKSTLERSNRNAAISIASFGDIDPGILFETQAYDPASRSGDVMRWLGPEALERETEPLHDATVSSVSIVREQPLHAVTLTLLVEALAWHCGSDLLRLKGIVRLAESPDRPAVIHGVQHVFHPIEMLDAWPSEDRRCRLVLIGRNLHAGWISALIDALETEVAQSGATPTGTPSEKSRT